jgi:hypothetical protein
MENSREKKVFLKFKEILRSKNFLKFKLLTIYLKIGWIYRTAYRWYYISLRWKFSMVKGREIEEDLNKYFKGTVWIN